MRALVFSPPGGLENLVYSTDVPTPTAADLKHNEVLVRVAAAGIIFPELFWPVYQAKDGTWPKRIVCPDYSGVVEAVGSDVHGFNEGDDVMSFTSEVDPNTGVRKYQGGAAEYVIAAARSTVKKPWNISLRDAASIPLCALTAWQALHEQAQGKVRPGAVVLIAGAAGATGLWAVQIAKHMGARVTGTASRKEGVDTLKLLGVDETINYRDEDITAKGRRFDIIIDAVGGETFRECAKVVKTANDGGILISLVEFQAATKAPQDVDAKFFIWRGATDQLEEIVRLVEDGQLQPKVDSSYPLERGVEAFVYVAQGHCCGKVVLEI